MRHRGTVVGARLEFVSTSAHASLHRPYWRSRRALGVVLGVLVIAGAAVVISRVVLAPGTPSPAIRFLTRPDLASNIDGLVIGTARTSPGVTAYVLGPRGAWVGAAGVANVRTGEKIRPDARMRLESVSKLFTATLILQLQQQGKLHVTDTVQRWLPGLLRSYGSKITIRELLTHRSGLISDSDIGPGRAVILRQLARVKDTKLRAQLTAFAERAAADPSFPGDPIWLIRWAAWLPLQFAPGTGYHYSNLGYDILGLIAERATGRSLPRLFEQQIFGPLGLKHTAYDPTGPIQGPHAHGYRIAPNGKTTDTTAVHSFKGADGGIVSNAQDTATFLIALMSGKLLNQKELAGMKGENFWRGGRDNGAVVTWCGSRVYGHAGGGEGYTTEAWVNGNGTRAAVLLLNSVNPPFGGETAIGTTSTLYCSA